MNLVDKRVKHKTYGEGVIVKCDDSYIEIFFPGGSSENLRFVFPSAFGTYLTLLDQKASNWVGKMVQKRKKERQAEELRLKKLKAMQKDKWLNLLRQEGPVDRRIRKVHPRSQAVFWCARREKNKVFAKWNVFTGSIKSGRKKGQPRQLARVKQNSACLLTARAPGMPEKSRRILGAFMVNEHFDPKLARDGYIPAHPDYRLCLTAEESKRMLFWNYYVNERYPHKITWNTGRHRYFNNTWMAKILRDIISLKKKPREQEYAELFFEYFCRMNRINKGELPPPRGALTHIHPVRENE